MPHPTTYPFSPEDDELFASARGGSAPEMLAELEMLRKTRTETDGLWRANTVGGYATRHCSDVRLYQATPKYAIVYWGGTGAETVRLWSFHIARARPNAIAFDQTLDVPVNLAAEKLRMLVDTYSGRKPLQDGMFVANEGNEV